VASHGVGCSSECCVYRSIRRIGLPVPISSPCFQRLDGFSPVPSPVPLRVRVHPLVSFASPSEYVLLVTCPTPKRRTPSLGSCSPSRHKRVKSTLRRVSHTRLRSALSVSHALDGLLLRAPLRACFIPLPRPGFALQGLSPLPSRLASSASRALMSLPSFSSRRVAPPLPVPLAPPPGR
jgi:hypothetical protein